MRYSDETKTAVIEALRDGEELNDVAERFDITRPTVKRWWSNQEEHALSPRHRLFVETYFRKNMNGTRAYKDVYGVEDDNTAAVNASRLLRNAKVAEVVKERIGRKAMGLDEVLARLGDQARFDPGPYIVRTDAGVGIDVEAMKRDGYGHMLRGAYEGRDGPRVEITNPDDALKLMLQHYNRAASGREDDPIHVRVPDIGDLVNRIYGDDDGD